MKSLWTNSANTPEFPTLNKDAKTNVLIIGGGICGILTAYFLQEKGIHYILVEKNRICNGTTQNTTAKITIQHGLIYQKILKNYGIEKAQMYLTSNLKAFSEYEKLCKNINCNFEYKDNFVYSLNNYKILSDEIKALEKIGYKAYLKEKLSLPLSAVGAVCFEKQAQFHPLKFISHITKNLNIYENTVVKNLTGTTAITNHGKIYTDKIIVATHFPFINKYGSYFLKLYQHRSYVVAINNAQQLDGMYVDEEKTGLSFRNYGNLLLIGGGSHRTGERGGNYEELRNFTKIRYPHSKEICHWATQDCMSLDDIPYIGNYSPNTPNIYVASGFNKWGITGAMTSAMILSDICGGIKNQYAEVFNPSRSILKFQLLINGFKSAKNLLSPTIPRCPHLGCALKWNKVEHSWDCPCHGSRFESNGNLINNPSKKNLKL